MTKSNPAQIHQAIKLLEAAKALIATEDLWITNKLTMTDEFGDKCYCARGAVWEVQSVYREDKGQISIDNALHEDAAELFPEYASMQYEGRSRVVLVNDQLGFHAVHRLFDYTINKYKNLLLNYEHTTDPY